MNKRRIPLTNEEPKHRKKSSAKGQPRADHKHNYETVLLGNPIDSQYGVKYFWRPYKVGTVCGRAGKMDRDPSYYISKDVYGLLAFITDEDLSDKAISLPKWKLDSYYGKFAHQVPESEVNL